MTTITKPTIGDENKGYTVHKVYHALSYSVVVAKSDTAPAPWVCWSWSKETGYYSGTYTNTEEAAVMEMTSRIVGEDLLTLTAAGGAAMLALNAYQYRAGVTICVQNVLNDMRRAWEQESNDELETRLNKSPFII